MSQKSLEPRADAFVGGSGLDHALAAERAGGPRILQAPFTNTYNPNPIPGGVQDAMHEALQDATCPVLCLFDGMDSTGPSPFLPRIIAECNKVNPKWKFILSSLP